jgi:hypothetical protein
MNTKDVKTTKLVQLFVKRVYFLERIAVIICSCLRANTHSRCNAYAYWQAISFAK